MSTRRKLLLGASVLSLALITWFLILPVFQYSAARKKFPLGMKLEDAQRVARQPFRVTSAAGGVTYGPREGPHTPVPPDNLKDTEVLTMMDCNRDGAFLLFNWRNRLIEIRPSRSLIDLIIWKQTRSSHG